VIKSNKTASNLCWGYRKFNCFFTSYCH